MGTMNITNAEGVPSSITFGPAPTIPDTFTFGPTPDIQPGSFTFGPAPRVDPATFTFGPTPDIQPGSFTFGPAPRVDPATFTFGPTPDIQPGSFTFGPSPNVQPGSFTFGPSPRIDPATFTFGPSPNVQPGSFTFGPAPNIPNSMEFGVAPTVSVAWGTVPTISVNIGEHVHSLDELSDVSITTSVGPILWRNALVFVNGTGWTNTTIGQVGVGGTPLGEGWPAGSLGAALNDKAPKSNASFSGNFTVESESIRIQNSKTPSSSSDVGTQGQMCWDSNYLYVCVAENTWKRSSLASW